MAASKRSWLLAGGFLGSIVLASCVSKNTYELSEMENAKLRQQTADQTAQREADVDQMLADKKQISHLQGAIKYTIESDLLFKPGSWEMSAQGKETIAKIAPKLAPSQRNKLVVHGYADNQPIGPGLEKEGIGTNRALSQKRAEAVKEFLITQGVNPDMVEAIGHGESRPIATNDTEKGRAKNRRVELTLGG